MWGDIPGARSLLGLSRYFLHLLTHMIDKGTFSERHYSVSIDRICSSDRSLALLSALEECLVFAFWGFYCPALS